MRISTARTMVDARFDVPPVFPVVERRLASRALECWRSGGGGLVAGFEAQSLVIADPAGLAVIESVGDAVAAAFNLEKGMAIDGRPGLAAEIRAACCLIAIDPQPVPFEASLSAPGRVLVLARGIAVPIGGDLDAGVERVQIVVSWREVLNRAASTRLRRELGVALRLVVPKLAKIDPFSPDSER